MVVDVRYVRMVHVHKEMAGGGGGGPEARGEERRRGEKRRGGRKKAPSEEPCMWRGSLQVRRVKLVAGEGPAHPPQAYKTRDLEVKKPQKALRGP